MAGYESWAAAQLLASVYVLRIDRSLIGCLKGGLMFGWMPALWILTHRGLSTPGSFVIESRLSIWRLLASPTACAEWVAVWSDYPSAVSELAGRQPVQVLRCGPM